MQASFCWPVGDNGMTTTCPIHHHAVTTMMTAAARMASARRDDPSPAIKISRRRMPNRSNPSFPFAGRLDRAIKFGHYHKVFVASRAIMAA